MKPIYKQPVEISNNDKESLKKFLKSKHNKMKFKEGDILRCSLVGSYFDCEVIKIQKRGYELKIISGEKKGMYSYIYENELDDSIKLLKSNKKKDVKKRKKTIKKTN